MLSDLFQLHYIDPFLSVLWSVYYSIGLKKKTYKKQVWWNQYISLSFPLLIWKNKKRTPSYFIQFTNIYIRQTGSANKGRPKTIELFTLQLLCDDVLHSTHYSIPYIAYNIYIFIHMFVYICILIVRVYPFRSFSSNLCAREILQRPAKIPFISGFSFNSIWCHCNFPRAKQSLSQTPLTAAKFIPTTEERQKKTTHSRCCTFESIRAK